MFPLSFIYPFQPTVSLPTCFHAAKEDETVENPSRDYIVKRQRRFDIFLKLQVQILVASDKDILRSTLLPPTLFSKLGNKHHDQIHSHWTLGVVIGLIKHGIYSNDLAFALSPVTSHVRITCLWWVERRGIKGGSWRYKVTVQSFACVFSRTSPCFLGPIWKTSRAVLIHFRWWSNTIHVEYLFFGFDFFPKRWSTYKRIWRIIECLLNGQSSSFGWEPKWTLALMIGQKSWFRVWRRITVVNDFHWKSIKFVLSWISCKVKGRPSPPKKKKMVNCIGGHVLQLLSFLFN